MRLSAVPGRFPRWAAGPWAIVTAWNPGAQQVPDTLNPGALNNAAQERLLAQIVGAGLAPRPALNGSGEWAEQSLLVPGASLTQARAWGEAFGQKAVLFGVGSRAALVWLPEPTEPELTEAGPAEPGPTERFWAVQASCESEK